jgi:hypothetical protein
MVTDKATLEKIKEIIQKHYKRLTISVLGRDSLTKKELAELGELGIDTSNKDSLLAMIYYHNFINHPIDEIAPTSVEDMKAQQSVQGLKPEGESHEYTVDNLNGKTKQLIEKMKTDVATRIEGLIRENNDSYKMDALQNLDRTDIVDQLTKESTLGGLRQKLRDTAGDANRDWKRIAITETSNAIGIASVDRIVSNNVDKPLDDIYVFRITVKDAKTCKWCRRFYDDTDGSPKLYKLSFLLDNGSNYGKKTEAWQPVIGATHANERCSQMIELKPGWALKTDGSVGYIGLDKWKNYIFEKIQM